jgi:hypothetical protein
MIGWLVLGIEEDVLVARTFLNIVLIDSEDNC